MIRLWDISAVCSCTCLSVLTQVNGIKNTSEGIRNRVPYIYMAAIPLRL